jgi:hypothetical protein
LALSAIADEALRVAILLVQLPDRLEVVRALGNLEQFVSVRTLEFSLYVVTFFALISST